MFVRLLRPSVSTGKTLKAWYARATRSRLAVAFCFVILANFAAQMTLHTIILRSFARDSGLVTNAIDAAGVQRGFTVIKDGIMEICSGVPFVRGTTCYAVNGTANTSTQCAEGLTWLENYLINSKSEEIAYLTLESWMVVISLIALLDESIPHLIIVLSAQLVNTGWISYRIARDISANRIYNEIVVNKTCNGFDILEREWGYNMFYVTLGFSIAALFVLSFLVAKLIKLYSKTKLSSVGSPPVMNRMLKWRLWMRVFLQFTSFFTLSSAAVWFDKRHSLRMASYYTKSVLYDVGFYVTAILIVPWLLSGTHAINKENRPLFVVYAFLSIVLVVISSLWFASPLYRYEYLDWRTFSFVTTLADILLVMTCVLSVVCRLNFGKGLAHFLVVEQKLQAAGFAYDTFLYASSDKDGGRSSSRRGLRVASPSSPSPLNRPEPAFTRRPTSVCSVETAVFATWLPPIAIGRTDEEAGTSLTGERENTIVNIAWDEASLSSDLTDEDSSSDRSGETQGK